MIKQFQSNQGCLFSTKTFVNHYCFKSQNASTILELIRTSLADRKV